MRLDDVIHSLQEELIGFGVGNQFQVDHGRMCVIIPDVVSGIQQVGYLLRQQMDGERFLKIGIRPIFQSFHVGLLRAFSGQQNERNMTELMIFSDGL